MAHNGARKRVSDTVSHAIRPHIATRQDRAVTTAIVALLMIVGFLLGYWVSEMERDQDVTVVFEDPGGSGLLSEEDIRALRGQASPPPAGNQADRHIPAPPAAVQGTDTAARMPADAAISGSGGGFVASVNGTRYYYPDCGDVSRIKEENLVWFATEQEAIQAGYEMSRCVENRRSN